MVDTESANRESRTRSAHPQHLPQSDRLTSSYVCPVCGKSRVSFPGYGKRHAAYSSPSSKVVGAALKAHRGFSKADAARLFQRVAANSPLPVGKVRAGLIPDSSWKRSGRLLGPQASQTAARLSHVLSFAKRVWGNEADAIEWLNNSHSELQGATPLSFLRTEAGGRAVESLLAALEFGFPV
jgi:putative toxin-antitoxin system antitoxin component (TIGR02293 family)